jgi:hypothetical protein
MTFNEYTKNWRRLASLAALLAVSCSTYALPFQVTTLGGSLDFPDVVFGPEGGYASVSGSGHVWGESEFLRAFDGGIAYQLTLKIDGIVAGLYPNPPTTGPLWAVEPLSGIPWPDYTVQGTQAVEVPPVGQVRIVLVELWFEYEIFDLNGQKVVTDPLVAQKSVTVMAPDIGESLPLLGIVALLLLARTPHRKQKIVPQAVG